jgi:preprotein translocase SecF subunit
MKNAKDYNYDFLGKRFYFVALSFVLMGVSLIAWFATGDEKFGVDFRGGSEVVVRYTQDVQIDLVREEFRSGGFPEVIVQNFGGNSREFSIRLASKESGESSKKVSEDIKKTLQSISTKSNGAQSEILREEFVGPVIGAQIRHDAIIAGLIGLIVILIYVSVQFDFAFAVGAVIALMHDSIIAVGATMLSGRELGSATLAAVLTIIGYSVNDTIIVYDRIRENLVNANRTGSAGKREGMVRGTLIEIMNLSVNQTLSRTILTSLTVFFVCMTLWLFGGDTVGDLAFTLLIGVVVGTYSSVFTACPMVLWFTKGK